jgi:hypothetical protein
MRMQEISDEHPDVRVQRAGYLEFRIIRSQRNHKYPYMVQFRSGRSWLTFAQRGDEKAALNYLDTLLYGNTQTVDIPAGSRCEES